MRVQPIGRRRRVTITAVSAALLSMLVFLRVTGQTGEKDVEWRTYGADLANTHYSPVDQINGSNFNRLEVAWRFKTDSVSPRPETNLQSTPLMVNGILYSTAGTARAVVALDAVTGKMLWSHTENEGVRATNAPRQLSGRGLAYWASGTEERVLYVTPGYRLIALNAMTGVPVPSFGQNGVVDLKLDDDQIIDLEIGEVGLHATPVVAGDTVIVGAAHRAAGAPRVTNNVKGYVRGFDVRTGKRLWIFHTIPRPGEVGYDSWEDKSADINGNGGVWVRSAWMRNSDWHTFRLNCPREIFMEAIGPETDCSANRLLPSTSKPDSGNGTTNWCTTASGTSTSPAPRCSSTLR
jgi:quinoprotein glucose dehydrogenase